MWQNRREFIVSGTCALCAATASSAQSASRLFDGCLITDAGYREFNSSRREFYHVADGIISRNQHFHTTGNASLDRDLDRALSIVADLFGVNPAFGFYDPAQYRGLHVDESLVMNAWAKQEDTAIPGTHGTVAFGWDFFQNEFYNYDNTGSTIMAVVAHEFGHILQGNRGHLDRLHVGYPRRSEINADFLAGYFIGARKRAIPSIKLGPVGDLFLRLGRSAEGNPLRTHGNAKERIDAAEAGFRLAYVQRASFERAVAAGLEYVGT